MKNKIIITLAIVASFLNIGTFSWGVLNEDPNEIVVNAGENRRIEHDWTGDRLTVYEDGTLGLNEGIHITAGEVVLHGDAIETLVNANYFSNPGEGQRPRIECQRLFLLLPVQDQVLTGLIDVSQVTISMSDAKIQSAERKKKLTLSFESTKDRPAGVISDDLLVNLATFHMRVGAPVEIGTILDDVPQEQFKLGRLSVNVASFQNLRGNLLFTGETHINGRLGIMNGGYAQKKTVPVDGSGIHGEYPVGNTAQAVTEVMPDNPARIKFEGPLTLKSEEGFVLNVFGCLEKKGQQGRLAIHTPFVWANISGVVQSVFSGDEINCTEWYEGMPYEGFPWPECFRRNFEFHSMVVRLSFPDWTNGQAKPAYRQEVWKEHPRYPISKSAYGIGTTTATKIKLQGGELMIYNATDDIQPLIQKTDTKLRAGFHYTWRPNKGKGDDYVTSHEVGTITSTFKTSVL